MLRAAIKPNPDGIQHLSITEDLHTYEVLMDSITEKTSVSKKAIFGKYKFDFDKQPVQKLFFELFEYASDVFY